MSEKKLGIFIPSEEEKKIMEKAAHEVIDVFEKYNMRGLMKAHVLGILVEGFKEISGIDIFDVAEWQKKVRGER